MNASDGLAEPVEQSWIFDLRRSGEARTDQSSARAKCSGAKQDHALWTPKTADLFPSIHVMAHSNCNVTSDLKVHGNNPSKVVGPRSQETGGCLRNCRITRHSGYARDFGVNQATETTKLAGTLNSDDPSLVSKSAGPHYPGCAL